MDFIKIIKRTAAVAPWLILAALAAVAASADPAALDTITIAAVTPAEKPSIPLVTAQLGDASRVEAQIREDLRADMDATMARSLTALLAAAERPANED